MKVLFGIATLSAKINVDTIVSLENATNLLDKEGIEHDTLYICGKSPVASARGDLVGIFNKLDHTDLFLIDDDVSFPADAILRLLKSPVKVIGGAYPIKDDKVWHYAGIPKTIDGIPIGKDGIMEAENVAGGFLRIKRVVIEEMIKAYPELKYIEYGRESYNLFGTYIEDGYLWGDDYSFCNRWKKIGGQLWIDPDIDFVHIGTKKYEGNYHNFLLDFAKGNIKMDKNEEGICGWMTNSELTTLKELSSKVDNIVEVGSWKGRSTKVLLENCKGKVYSVDHFKGTETDGSCVVASTCDVYGEFIQNVGSYQNLEVLRGDSIEMAKTFNGNNVDMVFIDAGHSYEECKADIEAWLPKCTKIIAGHDFGMFPGVDQAVMEKFDKDYTIKVKDSIWWVELQEA